MTDEAKAECALCEEWTSDPLDHLRVVHPAVWDELEKWPDGGVVVAPFIEDCTEDDG